MTRRRSGRERELLEPLRERADVVIDTSDLSASRLRKVVADKMLPQGSVGKLAVTLLTLRLQARRPRDADLMFDVRFLPNPHYEADLRDLTGLDARGREYVENSDGIDGVLRPPRRRCSTTCSPRTSRRARRT